MTAKKLKRLANLSLQEQWTLFLSIFLLPMVALSLKVVGFRNTRSFIKLLAGNKPESVLNEQGQMASAIQIARMVLVAANYGPYHANCLKKSLVIWWLLLRVGINTEIKIGVNKDDVFKAHAWVEFRGGL